MYIGLFRFIILKFEKFGELKLLIWYFESMISFVLYLVCWVAESLILEGYDEQLAH